VVRKACGANFINQALHISTDWTVSVFHCRGLSRWRDFPPHANQYVDKFDIASMSKTKSAGEQGIIRIKTFIVLY